MKFFVTTLTSWDEIPRARHQVTEELLRAGHEVVFVEKNRTGRPAVKTRDEKPGLTLVTPFFPVDYRIRCRMPLINELYQDWLFPSLKKLYGNAAVINFDFAAHRLHRSFKRNIYYCYDEHIGNCRYRHLPIKRYPRMVEQRVAREAGLCVSTTGYLTRKLNGCNPRVCEIPLGGPPPQTSPDNRNFEKRKTITVGLMGAIRAGHVSVDMINRLASEPGFRLVVIGNVGEHFRKNIRTPGRIRFTGVLTGEVLYEEMAAFDVAVAPYNLEMINPGVTPNKLLQYLACACPVVISSIPNIQGLTYPRGTVYVADGEQEFVEFIRTAYAEDCPAFAAARLQYAAGNTWEKRVQLLLRHLKENNLMD